MFLGLQKDSTAGAQPSHPRLFIFSHNTLLLPP
jgi:hypothetical protein